MSQPIQRHRTAEKLVLLIAVLWLVTTASHSQECETSIEAFPVPAEDEDSIYVRAQGGFPYSLKAASVDEFGKAAYFRNGGCLVESEEGAVEASEFNQLLTEFRQALTRLHNQPLYPWPTTLQQLLAMIDRRRLEATCMSHVDGVDIELSVQVSGDEFTFSCVTGPLQDFGYSVLRTATRAVNTDVGLYGD